MRIFRAYYPFTHPEVNQIYQLSPETSHHLARVLRVHIGDPLEIFDGQGRRFAAKVHTVGKQVSIYLLHALESNTQSPLAIHLAVAVGKADKMDWIVQKATELGVCSIQPLLTKRGVVQLSAERFEQKHAHWQEVARSACVQSGYDFLPPVHSVLSLPLFLKNLAEMPNAQRALKLALHPSASAEKISLICLNQKVDDVFLLIGPEGGFDDAEVGLAQTHAFRLASLGPRILRMETAAVAGIALLQGSLGDI